MERFTSQLAGRQTVLLHLKYVIKEFSQRAENKEDGQEVTEQTREETFDRNIQTV